MKIKRNTILLTVAVIFLIVFAVLFSLNSGKISEADTVKLSLTTLNSNLAKAKAEGNSLQAQITQINDKIRASQLAFDKMRLTFAGVDANAASEAMLKLLDRNSLKVLNMTVSSPSQEKQGAVVFNVTSVNLELSGTPDNLMGFVNSAINSSSLTGIVLKEVSLEGIDGENPTLRVSISIYGN